MAQPSFVMSFRKRLIKRGYKDVSIKILKDKKDIYIVTAIDPLFNIKNSIEVSLSFICNSFRF